MGFPAAGPQVMKRSLGVGPCRLGQRLLSPQPVGLLEQMVHRFEQSAEQSATQPVEKRGQARKKQGPGRDARALQCLGSSRAGEAAI
jgi:hypothetical protein